MTQHDWSRFTRRISIKAPKLVVYRHWTIPANLESWFLRDALFRVSNGDLRNKNSQIYAGDSYEWLLHGYADTVVEKGKVIEANGVDRIKFSFTGGAVVTVDLTNGDDQTLITLTQEDIPTDDYGKAHYNLECQVGWTFYLTNLKSILEGGIDLRNKNVTVKDVVNS